MTNKSKLLDLASKNSTPLLVIDHEIIRNNYNHFLLKSPSSATLLRYKS